MILQPFDQGVIKICLIILKLYRSIQSKPSTSVSDTLEHFWKVDNEDCNNVIKMTWDKLNTFTMNTCLKMYFTKSCEQLHGIPMVEKESAETLRLANGIVWEGALTHWHTTFYDTWHTYKY